MQFQNWHKGSMSIWHENRSASNSSVEKLEAGTAGSSEAQLKTKEGNARGIVSQPAWVIFA